MAKKYDICETSRMRASQNRAMIDVESSAKTDLQNGRLTVINAEGKIEYAKTGDKLVRLHASVEKMYQPNSPLTDFIVKQGDKARSFLIELADRFKTTAIDSASKSNIAVGDLAIIGTEGQLKVVASSTDVTAETFVAKVVEVGTLGLISASFGFEGFKAIKVEVIKC